MSNVMQPKALVYRGPATCDGCPEAVAHLLRTSPSNFSVDYVGPKEKIKLTAEVLSKVAVYAQPGGGDLDENWPEMEPHRDTIRNFVSGGGRYLGFCLGAYLAGYTPGFGLLPEGADTDSEISQPGAQVKSEEDTVIQVNWTFGHGSRAGQTQRDVWLYFQDGAVLETPANITDAKILARYSSNGNIAALLTPFGKGWVGVVGPHPEATQDWYEGHDFQNPDGINLTYGHDFVETTYTQK